MTLFEPILLLMGNLHIDYRMGNNQFLIGHMNWDEYVHI